MWHKAFESDEVNNIIQALGIRFGIQKEGETGEVDSKEANIDKTSLPQNRDYGGC